MEIYYKVKNVTEEVISWPWVSGLLNPVERMQYNEFIKSPEFLGFDEQDKQLKKKTPDALKAIPFYEKLGKGEYFEEWLKTKDGTNSIRRLKWCIGPNLEVIRKKSGAVYILRDLCQRFKLKFNKDSNVDELCKIILDKFGSHIAVLTKAQVDESGLSAIVRRSIVQKKDKANPNRIDYEGLLELQEITPDEAKLILGDALEVDTSDIDLVSASYETLRLMAKTKEIPNYSKKTKVELIELLS